jgi:hypothetical protein
VSAVVVGQKYVFGYPPGFVTLPEYTKHRGHVVTVLRPLTEAEAAGDCPMYKVRAEDGWEGAAFEDELEPPADPFNSWMRDVNALLVKSGVEDLPDWDYRVAFDDGMSAEDAAREVIVNSGGPR